MEVGFFPDRGIKQSKYGSFKMAAASRPVRPQSLNTEICLVNELLDDDALREVFKQVAITGDYRTLCR